MTTNTFEARFREVLNDYINTQIRPDGMRVNSARVTGYDTNIVYEGYCSTCEWTRIIVEVYYVDADTARNKTFTYDGGMAELISEL